MGQRWLPCQVDFFLKETTKQHVQYNAIFVKNSFILGWDELAKDTPHGPHQGEAKNQNNVIIVGTALPGIKQFRSWQPLWLFLWISQVSGLARKQNASPHNNGVVCCSQSIKHKHPEEREKCPSLTTGQPVFSRRKAHACLCKKDVLSLRLICFRELAVKGGEAELAWGDWHPPFFTGEMLLVLCHLRRLGQEPANQGWVQATAGFRVVHKS